MEQLSKECLQESSSPQMEHAFDNAQMEDAFAPGTGAK
jgi:hypothetical protein